MVKYAIVSAASGILFGILDGIVHANPLASRLFEVYKPLARTSINIPAGIAIDLVYGFVLAGVFLRLYRCLPGRSGFTKGVSFAVLAWFFRVAMYTASQWMMFTVPIETLAYFLFAGLIEMLILGVFYGLALYPAGAPTRLPS